MSKVRINLWIEGDQRAALLKIKDSHGVNESEQIRRAIDLWLRARLGAQHKWRRGSARSARK